MVGAAEQDRSDVAQARDEWRASQSELNPERLVFIDETGAATEHGAPAMAAARAANA